MSAERHHAEWLSLVEVRSDVLIDEVVLLLRAFRTPLGLLRDSGISDSSNLNQTIPYSAHRARPRGRNPARLLAGIAVSAMGCPSTQASSR